MTLDPGQVLAEKTAQADSPELVRTRQYLNAICRFAAKLPSHEQMDDVAALATEAIFDVIGAENAAMLLVDERTGKPELVCLRRKDTEGNAPPFVVSQSVVQETLRQGVSLFTNNAAADDRFDGQSIMAQAIRSLMCVPIQSQERMIGTLYVDRRMDATRFRQSDLAVMSALGFQAGVALERARLIDDLQALFVGAMQTMVRSLEAKDAYTRGHSERVMRYALAIADRLGWNREQRDVLELGALMHDIGKIGVPDRVLLKPAPLDDEERALMSNHPAIAADVLEAMPNLDRLVPVSEIIAAVRHHHEMFDGTGYPDGLKGDAIPEMAQILAVVDAYDALTTTRPYREGRTREEAVGVLRTLHDTQVSGRIARLFEELLDDGLDRRLDRIPLRFARKTGGDTPPDEGKT